MLFVKERHLVFDYNFFHSHTQVRSTRTLPGGPCVAGVRVERFGKAGVATLFVDGHDCGSVQIAEMAVIVSSTGLDIGRSIAPLCADYLPPYVFEGVLRTVTFEVTAARPKEARTDAMVSERVTQGLQ